MTPEYERGWKQGHQTPELLREMQSGSAQAHLDNLEYHYRVEMERTECWTDRAAATRHRDYMTGMIDHARKDLTALIQTGY